MVFNSAMEDRELQDFSLRYKILQVDMLSKEDKEAASSIGSFIVKPRDVERFMGYDHISFKLAESGRFGEVCYKGVVVKLLYKRETIERIPGPAEPAPEKTIQGPDEWIGIDLINMDAAAQQKALSSRLKSSMEIADRLGTLWKHEEAERKRLEEELKALEGAKEKIRILTERVGLQNTQVDGLERDTETLKGQLNSLRAAMRVDKQNTVEELFPVLNTMWLAGIHKTGDELYSMLKGQMIASLRRISIVVIEPKMGEKFDPIFHNAVHAHQVPEDSPQIDCILSVSSIGWQFDKGSVIRPANVGVGVEKKE